MPACRAMTKSLPCIQYIWDWQWKGYKQRVFMSRRKTNALATVSKLLLVSVHFSLWCKDDDYSKHALRWNSLQISNWHVFVSDDICNKNDQHNTPNISMEWTRFKSFWTTSWTHFHIWTDFCTSCQKVFKTVVFIYTLLLKMYWNMFFQYFV